MDYYKTALLFFWCHLMNEALLATITGFAVGMLFSFFRLPIPAPPVLSGVMGIVGVYLGHVCFQLLLTRFFS